MSAVPSPSPTSSTVVQQLRRQLLRCQVTHATISTGYPTFDRLLPESGLPSGSVIEWISDEPGLHATTIALRCAAEFLQQPGALAVVDPLNDFHPMSVEHLGIPLSRLLLVRPCAPSSAAISSQAQRSDALWALEQLARCPGVRVVITWVDRLSSTAQRRLQLAVEKSGVTVFLMRPTSALHQTSWADLKFQVQSTPQVSAPAVTDSAHIRVQLVRSKNSVRCHGQVLLDCNHETGHVLEAAELADPASAKTPAY